MWRNTFEFFTILCLMAGGSGLARVVEASDPNPIVAIRVENPNGLEVAGLRISEK